MIITYYNRYAKENKTWDTETQGTYFTSNAEGQVLGLDETEERGLARLAWMNATRPDRQYNLAKGPCLYSDRGIWITVGAQPSEEVIKSAAIYAAKRYPDSNSSHRIDYNNDVYRAYKKRHHLSTSYL